MVEFLLWWVLVELIGWLALPIALRVLGRLPDAGYTFSKSIGLLVSSYILWLGGSTHFLRNDLAGIVAAILIMTGISGVFYFQAKQQQGLTPQKFVRQNRKLVVTVEIVFTVAFAAWAILRAYAPDKIMSAGGEKFMEIAFLNAILNSRFFPPLDPWLSGFAISYYHFGYVMMAMLTRLSGVAAGVGFDLYDALLFALTFLGAFGIVYNLVGAARHKKPSPPAYPGNAISYGLLGGLMVAVMGNLEGLLEVLYSAKALPESFWKWINIPDLAALPASGKLIPTGHWWQVWWHASRVIQDLDLNYNPVGVSPISEFPSFSFILGDNHPHVLALPFVLLAIGLSLAVLLKTARPIFPADPSSISVAAPDTPEKSWRKALIPLDGDWILFLFASILLGGLAFLNTWDFPIYLGLLLLAYLTGLSLRAGGWHTESLKKTAILAAELLVGSVLLYLFFYIGFGSQAGGVLPYVLPPTRLAQYLVIFGPFIFILFAFLIAYLSHQAVPAAEKKAALFSGLKNWGWVLVACLAIFGLLLLATSLSSVGQQLAEGEGVDPFIQGLLGTSSLSEALRKIFTARLRDPWLLLVLSALVALGATAFQVCWKTIMQNKLEASLEAATGELAEPGNSTHAQADLFVFILVFIGILLTLSVEFFYLRDSFGMRMNTIFKFYYQGWVMMGIASAYGLWWISHAGKPFLGMAARGSIVLFSTVLILGGMVYPVLSGLNRVQNFTSEPNLDGASGVARSNPQDWAAIQWLQKNAAIQDGKVPVLLEAPGGSYNYEGRISAFTGLPAVLGWAVHESQWRGTYDEQGKREPDIITIYTSSDERLTLELLKKWSVDYVIFGPTEHNYIQKLCLDQSRRCNLATVLGKFDQVLIPVFTQDQMIIYQVP